MKSDYASKRIRPRIEQLESRDTPATLVNPTTLTYQDIDGDNVTVKLSKPLLSDAIADNVFGFNAGDVNQSNADPQQLKKIDLGVVGDAASGVNVSVVATRSPVNGGDGYANVGVIATSGADAGMIWIDGDLRQINAGDADIETPALVSLKVHSMGRYGDANGGVMFSNIQGSIGALSIRTDMVGVRLQTFGASAATDPLATIGSIAIGGSLIGDANKYGGSIAAGGRIGKIRIGGDMVGSGGETTGAIHSNAGIGNVQIGGSIVGGSGPESGRITTGGNLGPVRIGGDIRGGSGFGSAAIQSDGGLSALIIGGSLIGGAEGPSGSIDVQSVIGKISVGRDVVGGTGVGSGQIYADDGIGDVRIGGSLVGGSASSTGFIRSDGDIGKVTFGGSVRGGPGADSGLIYALEQLGTVKIGGDVQGGAGLRSGAIQADQVAGVTIQGALTGGAGLISGTITSDESTGAIRIGSDVRGGAGDDSGVIVVGGPAIGISIGGSLIGNGTRSGQIFGANNIGFIAIAGDVKGGNATGAGRIFGLGNITRIAIGGSLVGGTKDSTGSIQANGNLGSFAVYGDIIGGNAPNNNSLEGTGYVQAARIGNVFVGGSIIAGRNNNADPVTNFLKKSGSIRSQTSIGRLNVIGSLIGNSTNPVIVTAVGAANPLPPNDLAIATIKVGRRVEWANFLAGYDTDLNAQNADAQIGTVTAGQDWIASNLVAGAVDDDADGFGLNDAIIPEATDDPGIRARIGSVVIGGQAIGTLEGADHYGIVAELIASFSIGGTTIALDAGPNNDDIDLGPTGDFRLLEVVP